MNNLLRLMMSVIPVIALLLVALAVMSLLASLGPALIPGAILGGIGLGAWLVWRRR